MPTKRTRVARKPVTRITPEAVAAFKVGDYGKLHDALRLKPRDESPLWVMLNTKPEPRDHPLNKASIEQAVELRRELLKAARMEGK